MSNVICFKSRTVVSSSVACEVNPSPDRRDEINDLIQRYSDSKGDVAYIKACQTSNYPFPYVGCTHGTVYQPYTYFTSNKLRFPVPNGKCLPQAILGADIITDGGGPDAFIWMDQKYAITLNILKHAKIIYTRSDLVAHDEYIEQLDRGVNINLVYCSTDSDVNRVLHPGSASYLRLVKAYNKLKLLGFNVNWIFLKFTNTYSWNVPNDEKNTSITIKEVRPDILKSLEVVSLDMYKMKIFSVNTIVD